MNMMIIIIVVLLVIASLGYMYFYTDMLDSILGSESESESESSCRERMGDVSDCVTVKIHPKHEDSPELFTGGPYTHIDIESQVEVKTGTPRKFTCTFQYNSDELDPDQNIMFSTAKKLPQDFIIDRDEGVIDMVFFGFAPTTTLMAIRPPLPSLQFVSLTAESISTEDGDVTDLDIIGTYNETYIAQELL